MRDRQRQPGLHEHALRARLGHTHRGGHGRGTVGHPHGARKVWWVGYPDIFIYVYIYTHMSIYLSIYLSILTPVLCPSRRVGMAGRSRRLAL